MLYRNPLINVPYPLYVFKGDAVDNRLMHIFDYLPLAFINITGMLIPVMLGGLEIDYIAAILLPCENMGQGSLVPVIPVILIQLSAFRRPLSCCFK